MSDRTDGAPIDAMNAAVVVPGNGIVVHRKPLTVVVAAGDDPVLVAPRVTALVDELVDTGAVDFGPVAERLQDFVVNHQPLGVAAVLDISPEPIAFLFDQAIAVDGGETHRGEGRSGWTTVFVNHDTVVLTVGSDERATSAVSWTSLWAGTVPGRGAGVPLTRSIDPTALRSAIPAPPPPPPSEPPPPETMLAGPEPWGQPAASPEPSPSLDDEPPPPPDPEAGSRFGETVAEGEPTARGHHEAADVGLGFGAGVASEPVAADSGSSQEGSSGEPTADEPGAPAEGERRPTGPDVDVDTAPPPPSAASLDSLPPPGDAAPVQSPPGGHEPARVAPSVLDGIAPRSQDPAAWTAPQSDGPVADDPPIPGQPPPPTGQPIAGTPPTPGPPPTPTDEATAGIPPSPDRFEPDPGPARDLPPPAGEPIAGAPPLPGATPMPSAAVPPLPDQHSPVSEPSVLSGAPPLPEGPPPSASPIAGTPPMPGDQPLPGTPPMPGDQPLPGTPPMPGDQPLPGQPPLPDAALRQEPGHAHSTPPEQAADEDPIDAAKPSGQT